MQRFHDFEAYFKSPLPAAAPQPPRPPQHARMAHAWHPAMVGAMLGEAEALLACTGSCSCSCARQHSQAMARQQIVQAV